MFRLILLSIISIRLTFAQDTGKSGKASYYNKSFHGQETSNGEIYNINDFTAAHRTLAFNSILLVTNKQNHKSTIVRVNDRGPFKKSRVIDLSQSAAKKIGMIPFGVVQVKIVPLTYLDSYNLNESRLHNNEVWDCYGKKQNLSFISLYLWKTSSLKHAVYMASSLSIEYNINALIKISGSPEKRSYIIIVSGIKSQKTADELISVFRKDGFSKSGIYSKD